MLLCNVRLVHQALYSRVLLANLQDDKENPPADLHPRERRNSLEHCHCKPINQISNLTVGANIRKVLVVIFQCTPVNFWWNRTITGGHCVNNTKFLLGNSVPNIATDIAILLLPIPFIWNLQQSSGRKLALSGVFLLGGFVCVVSIIRLAIQLETDFTSPDLSWTITSFVMWTNVETNLAVVSGKFSGPKTMPRVFYLHPSSLSTIPPSSAQYFHKPC